MDAEQSAACLAAGADVVLDKMAFTDWLAALERLASTPPKPTDTQDFMDGMIAPSV